jgi:phage tail P2-like protein
MATTIDAFQFASLMVPEIASDPAFQAACAAIQGQFNAVTAAIPSIITIPEIAIQPSNILDNLAVYLNVYGYDQTLPNATKVSLILQSIQWHQKIGTPWVIQQACATIFSNAQIFEWFQYSGSAYHFQISMTQTPTGQQLTNMINVILQLKNVRSYFDGFALLNSSSGGLYIAGAVFSVMEWYVGGTPMGFPHI